MESFKSDHVHIAYSQETGITHLSWNHYTPSKEYHLVLEKALEIMTEHQSKKWIFDQRNVGVISVEDQKWVIENWTPRVIKQLGKGIKSAVILSKSIFGELSIKHLVDDTKEVVNTRYFENVDSAKEWLLQK